MMMTSIIIVLVLHVCVSSFQGDMIMIMMIMVIIS